MKRSSIITVCVLILSLLDSELSAQPGALDITFNPGTGIGTPYGQSGVGVWALALRDDGRIMVAGYFNSVNGQAQGGIARFLSDGIIDTDFSALQGTDMSIYGIALEPDGRVYIGGNFGSYNGIPRSHLARLRDDGSLDLVWPNVSFDNTIRSIRRMTNGSVMVVGDFTQVNGTARHNIAMLNTNASLDMSFDPGSGATDGTIKAAAVEPGGLVIIAGNFTTNSPVSRKFIARVYPDGSLDPTFDAGFIGGIEIRSIVLQPDGKVVIGGLFSSVNGYSRNGIARLGTNGLVDTGFVSPAFIASVIGLAPDNRILASGGLGDYPVVLLNSDGSLYSAFSPKIGSVNAFTVQPDGKVLVGGDFLTVNGTNISRIARLNGVNSPPTDLQFMAANNYFGTYLYGTVSNIYRVEWTSKLDTPSLWTPLFNVTLQTNPQFILDPHPASGQRFYRAVELP